VTGRGRHDTLSTTGSIERGEEVDLDLEALELLQEERLTGEGCDNSTCAIVTLCDPPTLID
jgi:hypothetical protein